MFDRLRHRIGREPLCNHRPDRGLYIHGYCLPLCARCTGILMGAVGASIACWLLHTESAGDAMLARPAIGIHGASVLRLLPGLLMIVPTAIDGFAEYAFGVESNNPRRLVTGLAAGIGCAIAEMGLRQLLS